MINTVLAKGNCIVAKLWRSQPKPKPMTYSIHQITCETVKFYDRGLDRGSNKWVAKFCARVGDNSRALRMAAIKNA
jgi:hypothetical protein